MGKDNLTFHTVMFPCTMLATKKPWTLLNNVSSTEYLNYEYETDKDGKLKPSKFSKSNNTGVFGDAAMETGINVEVWRYYLLINRPENSDTVFLWTDFIAKNNNELLANLGNMIHRVLTFVASPKQYDGKIPATGSHEDDTAFLTCLAGHLERYFESMDALRLKDGLKIAMDFSQECNGYLQRMEPWKLFKTNKTRCDEIIGHAINAVYMLATICEPFMPSFSAKVYAQLSINRAIEHETILAQYRNGGGIEFMRNLVKTGH